MEVVGDSLAVAGEEELVAVPLCPAQLQGERGLAGESVGNRDVLAVERRLAVVTSDQERTTRSPGRR